MRIEAYNQVNQIYQAQKINKPDKTAKTSRSDQVQISGLGKDLQTLKAAVKESPDIREDLVASIKSRINDGSYEVSGDDFASKLLEKYNAWG